MLAHIIHCILQAKAIQSKNNQHTRQLCPLHFAKWACGLRSCPSAGHRDPPHPKVKWGPDVHRRVEGRVAGTQDGTPHLFCWRHVCSGGGRSTQWQDRPSHRAGCWDCQDLPWILWPYTWVPYCRVWLHSLPSWRQPLVVLHKAGWKLYHSENCSTLLSKCCLAVRVTFKMAALFYNFSL